MYKTNENVKTPRGNQGTKTKYEDSEDHRNRETCFSISMVKTRLDCTRRQPVIHNKMAAVSQPRVFAFKGVAFLLVPTTDGAWWYKMPL